MDYLKDLLPLLQLGHHPKVCLLLLEQKEMLLEVHSPIFVENANHSSYPDSSLCGFYLASLNEEWRAQLSRGGRRESFFVTLVLVSNKSPLTIRHAEEHFTIPIPDPEPSKPLPCYAEPKLEPTADREPEPTAVKRV